MNKPIGVVALVMVATLWNVGRAQAQEFRGFAGAGMASDLNSRYPSFGGGVLIDLPTDWLSAGAQGDMFVSWPYVAGRGAAFGQVNVVRRGTFRPFLVGGYGWGELAGPLVGAGLDVRFPARRLGLRASVEDYLIRAAACSSVLL